MNWVDAKILAHGKFDSRCAPPMCTLPSNVALVFYSAHGVPVVGSNMRLVEKCDMPLEIQAWLHRTHRTVSNFNDLQAAITSFKPGVIPTRYVVPPLGNYHNYRLTHLGTELPVKAPSGYDMASHDP